MAVRRTAIAYGTFAALITLVVALIAFIVGLGIIWAILAGLVVGAGAAWLVYSRADNAALSALGARPAAPNELPRLENLVEGLVVANGFRMPTIHIVDDAAPNAAAVGRTPSHAAIVVTTGLLERLRRIELEGVLAHELSRIRSRETLAAVTAAQLAGRFLGFSEALSARAAATLLEPTFTLRADMAGVELTRYPPGLAGALTSMRKDGRSPAQNPRPYRHLWINAPDGNLSAQAFTIDDRIEVLHEL